MEKLSSAKHFEMTIKSQTVELDEWRNKFMKLNREYHIVQERMVLTIAELDNIKKRYESSSLVN